MTMVPRDPISEQQIKEAKQGVPDGDKPQEVTQETVDAQKVGAGTDQAPARNPGFKT